MITCASCKNKTSTDRCSNKPLKGLILCGTHAKVKNPRLWKDVNKLDDKALLIQKIWRGYAIRNWLKLCGPGVLKRSVCHNNEELFNYEDKATFYPLDYFSFEESGKVYWFDVKTMIENGLSKLAPANPYTREKLSFDTRQRLRKLIIIRSKRKLQLLQNTDLKITPNEILENTWIAICQIIEENGFPDVSPMHFLSLNRTQLYIFNTMLFQDIIAWAAQHTTPHSKRKRYVSWIKRPLGEYRAGSHTQQVSYLTGKCLLTMLNDYPESYEICFIIMSALHRV